MRSPWKIVSQLFSGRQEPSSSDAANEKTEKSPAGDHSSQLQPDPQVEAELSASVAVTGAQPHVASEDEGLGATRVSDAESARLSPSESSPTSQIQRAASSQDKAEGRVEKKGRVRPKQAGARTRKQTKISGAPEGLVKPSPVLEAREPQTFEDEVSRLDAEIQLLRRELAAKLRLQNDQLSRMLERFGDS